MIHLHRRTRLVYQVDGLVGQEAVVHILVAGIDGKVESLFVVAHAMKLLVLMAQLAQNMFGFLRGGLWYVYLLEPTHKSLGTRKMAIVFLVGCRTDETNAARLQIGLEHVRGIHRALAYCACAHQGMNLVDIDDVRIALFENAVHNLLDAVLEIATILGTGQQRADVELVNSAALQSLGHVALFYHTGQSPYQCSLTHTRFAHVQRVILVLAT